MADGSTDLWTVNRSGRHARPLTQTPGVGEDNAAWSPNGSSIVFLRTGPDGIGQVWLRSVSSGAERQLTFDAFNKSQVPDWSPDSRQIVYEREVDGKGDIWLMSADGSGQRPLIVNDLDDFGPNWSPDGRRIAFVRALPTGNQIYVANSDGKDPHVLAPSEGGQAVPGWQPRPHHHRSH